MKNDQFNHEQLLISAIEQRLELSFEERIEAHEQARKLVEDLSREGDKLRAGSKEAS
jgi:hypothetical protein